MYLYVSCAFDHVSVFMPCNFSRNLSRIHATFPCCSLPTVTFMARNHSAARFAPMLPICATCNSRVCASNFARFLVLPAPSALHA